MKIQCHVFVAISLDGYIAREDGQIDWLEQYNATLPKGEDFGYAHFYQTMDCIVLGRKSFEKVLKRFSRGFKEVLKIRIWFKGF